MSLVGSFVILSAIVTTDTTGSGTGGVITWNYSVAASAVEYLAAGQTKVKTFDNTLEDSQGGNILRTITVTITGTNDDPVLGVPILSSNSINENDSVTV